ncbi:MAG: FMN-binding protein [Candidatus Cloacimonetes bacterium]|nr:FMN-binding protein [Candidatus Cloacimonadota bacterium]
MANETAFREKAVYPVLFILLLSVVFVGILALMYRSNEPRIDAQNREAYEKTILSLCADSLASLSAQSAAEIQAAYPESYSEYIEAMDQDAFIRPAFAASYKGELVARVFDITGKGLWGTMRALVATSPDLKTLLGISVYEQSETPGLGGRIEEDWFTGQFRNKQVLGPDGALDLELVPEGQAKTAPLQVRQITGATITSKAVIDMLKEELARIAGLDTEEAK